MMTPPLQRAVRSFFPSHQLHRYNLSKMRTLSIVSAFTLSTLSASLSRAQDDSGPETTTDETSGEIVITEKAREHFRAGVNLLQDPDGARYELAYEQFKAAYAESPSWKVLGNLGITAMKLEKDGEAIDAFEEYLTKGGDQVSQAEIDQFSRDISTLRASVVTFTIRVNKPGAKLVDERITNRGGSVINRYPITDETLVFRARPGEHKLTLRLSGHEDLVWEINAKPGSDQEHSFELEEKVTATSAPVTSNDSTASSHQPIPLGVWIGAGVTGAFTVGAITTGVIALNKNGEYDDANNEGDPEADDLRKGVKSMNLVTDVLIGGAVAAGAITTILYLTRPTVSEESALQIDPIVGLNFAALSVSGKF